MSNTTFNPYLDMNFKDRSKEVETLSNKLVTDIKENPEYFAKLVADMFYHWQENIHETKQMWDFKNTLV